MKLLVNEHERITHEKLARVCESESARVCPKVRVKDVLPLDRSGVSSEHFSYGLTSHFDFVVTDKDWNALFAVEFDGSSHATPDALRRDSLKNELCDRFSLPLLRVRATHLKTQFKQWDLLTYFTETWFLARAFERAQESGDIPPDEYFDPMLVFADGKGRKWPYWFSASAQIAIQKLHESGKIAHRAPSHVAGYDNDGNIHYLAWIKVSDDAWATVRTAMRSQRFDVCTPDVLEQIGIMELHEHLGEVLAGRTRTYTDRQVEEESKRWRDNLRVSSSGGYCTMSLKALQGV